MASLEQAIKFALERRGFQFTLKPEQFQCILAIASSKDVMAFLPTGYRKSLIFQLLPDIFDCLLGVNNSIVLVVSPLNALMRDQVMKLNCQGVSACMIQGHSVFQFGEDGDGADIMLPLDELKKLVFKLLYLHPELCVYEQKILSYFNSPAYQERVRCVVIDEAHLVLEWDSFRPAYGKLDVLVSIFPSIPHMATTATATNKSQRAICNKLQLEDPLIVSVNPDRVNIFLESKERPATGEDKLQPILEPLCKELLIKKIDMPLTLVYGTLNVCAEGFMYFSKILGNEQYFPKGADPKSKNRLFSQYHAQYPTHEKDTLVNDLINGECKSRVIFVTVAFGIGVDLPSIRRVIHIGVPHTMEEYFQEIGPGGRDGLPAVATIYYNCYDLKSGKNSVDSIMKELVSGKECKRKLILNYFGHELTYPSSTVIHDCCDTDAAKCNCGECLSTSLSFDEQNDPLKDMSTEVTPNDISKEMSLLFSTNSQKSQIRKALEQHMETLYFGPSCIGGMTLATGFTLDLIDKTIEMCEQLTSIDAIEQLLPVFSREYAKVIYDIVSRFHTNDD